MATPGLTAEQPQVLGILMQPDRRLEDQTVDRMAADVGMDPVARARVLDGLEARGVVQNAADETLEAEIWIATIEAGEKLDPPPEDQA